MRESGRLRLSDLHWPLIIVATLIALLGVYNLHSAAAARDPQLFVTQALWMGIAAVGVALFLFVDYRVTESLAYTIFGAVVLLLLATLAQGHVAKGASRWLHFGRATFQPSEFAKLATVFCLARYFSTRMIPGGYSLGSLIRPLNPSRPLAVMLALTVFWGNAWLTDPVGQLARALRKSAVSVTDTPSDQLWFRAILLLAITGLAAGAVFAILRAERQSALLSPWPPTRRKRLIILTAVVAAVGIGAVVWAWEAPVLCDPIGVLVNYLVKGAAPGGPYERPQASALLRIVLSAIAVGYLAAAGWRLRRGITNIVEVIVAPADLMLLPAALILVQPDLGTAGVVILIGLSTMLVVGVRLRSLVILGAFGAVVATAGWAGVLKDYQKQRILTFIDPEQDTQGAGWNAVQSMIAVGSGRWTGKGHKGGTQTQLSFLPEQHTDFAFSVWAEEQGFLGSSLLVLLYLALIIIALSIAADAREHYGSLLATGAAAIILWQALINISMVIGLFPVVGITLPLFSYGGTSVLTIMGAVGILLNVHWRRRAH